MTTRLRLRDGESNLLAGLLREDERKSLTGFPGAIHVPILKQLFSANDNQIAQTDIVMLLTPHIVRTHELTDDGPQRRSTSARSRTSASAGRRRSSRRRGAAEQPRHAAGAGAGQTTAQPASAGRRRRARRLVPPRQLRRFQGR